MFSYCTECFYYMYFHVQAQLSSFSIYDIWHCWCSFGYLMQSILFRHHHWFKRITIQLVSLSPFSWSGTIRSWDIKKLFGSEKGLCVREILLFWIYLLCDLHIKSVHLTSQNKIFSTGGSGASTCIWNSGHILPNVCMAPKLKKQVPVSQVTVPFSVGVWK